MQKQTIFSENFRRIPPIFIFFIICADINTAKGNTFSQYAVKFTDELGKKLNSVKRVDVVWDVRQQDTSAKLARSTRGTGAKTRVRLSPKIPNWLKFLRVLAT